MQATLRFYAELNDFLPGDSTTIVHRFDVPGSVKDVIESCGVPHTEVDLIIVGGTSVDFGYRVRDGDIVSVYPVFESFDISPLIRLRPEPLRVPRFVLDGHLSKLAGYLRLLGFDALCSHDYTDHDLVEIASAEVRCVLTRDVGVLKHGSLDRGYFVRATDPRDQLTEVVRRFHLGSRIDPFTRCMECNGELTDAGEAEVADRLPEGVAGSHHRYRACSGCRRVYWRGSHFERLAELVEAARTADLG